MRRFHAGWALLLVGVAACGSAAGDDALLERASAQADAEVTTTAAEATTSTEASTTTTAPPTTTTAPPQRSVTATGLSPFALVGNLTLLHVASHVERVGFHQSGHDGAQPLQALETTANPVVLEDRGRDTLVNGAADVVVDPRVQIVSPVTGTVKRQGSYVLYCTHQDDYVVIAPDANPEWEVKVLHLTGEQVSTGQRVTAGETILATSARILPFESQVDELRTVDPAWPHVHIEVVDPRIPDRPTPGGRGC